MTEDSPELDRGDRPVRILGCGINYKYSLMVIGQFLRCFANFKCYIEVWLLRNCQVMTVMEDSEVELLHQNVNICQLCQTSITYLRCFWFELCCFGLMRELCLRAGRVKVEKGTRTMYGQLRGRLDDRRIL
jgi:hypothetical protein